MADPPNKKRRIESTSSRDARTVRQQRAAFLSTFSRAVSPPLRSTSDTTLPTAAPASVSPNSTQLQSIQRPKAPSNPVRDTEPINSRVTSPSRSLEKHKERSHNGASPRPSMVPSPFRLTSIRDLDPSKNQDAVSLHDILGNPLIKQAWVFNFCFNVDWVMTHFDSDVRDLVDVKIIHGSWRNEDGNKIGIDNACRRWKNVESLQAYLPDAFGTHHSKLFVLFSHDDTAEVIIHTANMLAQDWRNMTQAVWRSGPLPKNEGQLDKESDRYLGSGARFKSDFLHYLKAYGSKTKSLVSQLIQYDFSSVRGVLVASIPSKLNQDNKTDNLGPRPLWGHLGMKSALEDIKVTCKNTQSTQKTSSANHVVCQVSSIATLSVEWWKMFQSTLLTTSTNKSTTPMYEHVSIIYPTPQNVADSLDGYASGGSIHTKAQTQAHLKQIQSFHNQLCQWTEGPKARHHAGRHLAAPHIKTYICFDSKPTTSNPKPDIKWALLTSANLSTQAWGSLPKKKPESKTITKTSLTGRGGGKNKPKKYEDSETETASDEENRDQLKRHQRLKEQESIHIQSYEIGVLVWPELFLDQRDNNNDDPLQLSSRNSNQVIRMIPTFLEDDPNQESRMNSSNTDRQNGKTHLLDRDTDTDINNDSDSHISAAAGTIVQLHLPYDLPLTAYEPNQLPWSPQSSYDTPDRHGRRWPRDFYG